MNTEIRLGDTVIIENFAEAFPMTAARVVITADTEDWARTAAIVMSGYATSVIGCDAEAGIETTLHHDDTPDGRPGLTVLAFAFSRDALQKALVNRVGQCVMTCPTTAVYNGLPIVDKTINIGGMLRRFGDGWQISKRLDGRRYWRIPVMDGEFTCEESFGTVSGVAGGNLILLGAERAPLLAAASAAVAAMCSIPGVLLPFPGGIARSGSKVGSKYKGLRASTNTAFAPTLRGLVASELPAGVDCVYEIVIDGLSLEIVERATVVGVLAAVDRGGASHITSANYGGKLGPFHIGLAEVLARGATPTHNMITE